jgi:hypothetical protein
MKPFGAVAFSALLGAGALASMTAPASASIVCNGNVCWHTHEVYEYPQDAQIVVHPDTWRWRSNEHFAWKEHDGRGYWHSGGWKEF